MFDILIDKGVKEILGEIRLGCLFGEIRIEPSGQVLLEYISTKLNDFRSRHSVDNVSSIPMIKSTKEAYRKLGKDPSRYRPSAEALTRRTLQGKDLYLVNSLVDSLNLFSILTGISIGGYDRDKIEGIITFSSGRENEPYEAIGRGTLNIANLPLLRDDKGAFGSPTSDSTRTMITKETRNFLLVFFDFSPDNELEKIMGKADDHFRRFNSITASSISIYK
jgi:DNA/RNA-binding domain of Phe-tRNA-synthetase-like protein